LKDVEHIKAYRTQTVYTFVVTFIASLAQIMIGGLLIQGFVIKDIVDQLALTNSSFSQKENPEQLSSQ
jgi:hypothetical protein